MHKVSSLSYIINLSTRKMTFSAIFAGVSAIIVIVLLSYTPIVTLPTVRISFEGLLIKICGYLFGITVGFFAGVMTEVLVNLYRPTFFHWAYFLTLIVYGVIGGITKHISSVVRGTRKQTVVFLFIMIVLSVIASVAFTKLVGDHPGGHLFGTHGPTLGPSQELFFYLVQGATVMFLPFLAFIFRYILPNKKHLYREMLPIYFLAIITAYFVTIPLMPLGDSSSYNQPYVIFVIVAIVQTPINIIVNVFLILFVWKIIDKIITKGTYAKYNTT